MSALVILTLITLSVVVIGYIASAPRPLTDKARDVLICAAHSDDCVISGAEYAYGAIRDDRCVRIAYLTCSAPDRLSEIARTRRDEALAAWSSLGIPEKNLTFIDLPESAISGPQTYSDCDLAKAEATLRDIIASLPPKAAVIVPARGESHNDHRSLRRTAMKALRQAGRTDIVVYEVPEYNNFISFIHCPARALRSVVRSIPFLNRIVQEYHGTCYYVEGSRGYVFADTPARLSIKVAMLRTFNSQDGDLLVNYFGYRSLYRRVDPEQYPDDAPHAAQFRCYGKKSDWSVPAVGLMVLSFALLASYELADLTRSILPAGIPAGATLALTGSSVAAAYLVRRIRGSVGLETALFVWAVSLGLIANALWI